MCAMLEIERNALLKELGWRLLLQVETTFWFFLVKNKIDFLGNKKLVLQNQINVFFFLKEEGKKMQLT
jgi:hypothetical protein